jgi:hypothetical protein
MGTMVGRWHGGPMIIEIALGIVLGVVLLFLLPFILVGAFYLLLFVLAVAFVALLGWGAYELYQMLARELAGALMLPIVT